MTVTGDDDSSSCSQRRQESARTKVAVRWSEAVNALADRLDPMNRADRLAKELEPSDEVLARLD